MADSYNEGEQGSSKMPAYEYECRQCSGHFERRQKMSEPEVNACPECGGQVRRLISGGAGAITKGASAAPACETGGCGISQMGCGSCCMN